MSIANAQAILGTSFNIPASGGWYAIGSYPTLLKVTLPGPGTYQISLNIRSIIKVSGAGGYLLAALFDGTNVNTSTNEFIGSPIANTVRMIITDQTGTNVQQHFTTSFSMIYTTAETTPVVTVAVQRGDIGSPTWTTSQITQDTGNGETTLSYIQLS